MDTLSAAERSLLMAKVRGQDTKPEWVVRRLLHGLGYRYRLHGKGLPGRPDLVFATRRKVVFVNGCFWHRHACRAGSRTPKTRRRYWQTKLDGNLARDARQRRQLRRLGWRSLVVWECQTRPMKLAALTKRLVAFLES